MSKRKPTDQDDAPATPDATSASSSSSDEHAGTPGGEAAPSSSSSSGPTLGEAQLTSEELQRAADALVAEGKPLGELTQGEVEDKARALRTAPVTPKSGEATPVPADGGKGPPEAPPLPSEFVAPAQLAHGEDPRDDWGERPSLSELQEATRIEVRTKDPRAGETPVPGGVLATPQGTVVLVQAIEERGSAYLAALANFAGVDIRIVE